ncbi:MAG: hypothetical protein KAU20_00340 [Nanoarchaeota archaeon]|nr:hypothetical protein [Nanoarchaeota archaeon]
MLLFSIGCKMGPSEARLEEVYHKGNSGIEMDFLRNAPPNKVYDGDSLDISIELKNKGAYPETNKFEGKLEISGFDTNSIRGRWDGGNDMPSDLEGRSQYNDEGGYAIMTYNDRDGVHVPFDADYYEPTIIVHSCYKYKTIADPIVCIDPDPYKVVSEKKVCTIGDVSLSGGQGAPIAVTKIEEEVSSDKIYFRIHISNVGGGSVMTPQSYRDCPYNIEINDLDKVSAKIRLPYDSSPDCSPRGTGSDPIRLVNGRGYIFCKFRKPNTDSAYTTNLNIGLDYVYSSSISKKIKIVNIK